VCGHDGEITLHLAVQTPFRPGGRALIYRKVLDEALALAGKLGKKRMVERFEGLLGLYWTTEWDGNFETLEEHFNRKFQKELFYV